MPNVNDRLFILLAAKLFLPNAQVNKFAAKDKSNAAKKKQFYRTDLYCSCAVHKYNCLL